MDPLPHWLDSTPEGEHYWMSEPVMSTVPQSNMEPAKGMYVDQRPSKQGYMTFQRS